MGSVSPLKVAVSDVPGMGVSNTVGAAGFASTNGAVLAVQGFRDTEVVYGIAA